jgi:hypothetical protein
MACLVVWNGQLKDDSGTVCFLLYVEGGHYLAEIANRWSLLHIRSTDRI